jgi:hypothetical protein
MGWGVSANNRDAVCARDRGWGVAVRAADGEAERAADRSSPMLWETTLRCKKRELGGSMSCRSHGGALRALGWGPGCDSSCTCKQGNFLELRISPWEDSISLSPLFFFSLPFPFFLPTGGISLSLAFTPISTPAAPPSLLHAARAAAGTGAGVRLGARVGGGGSSAQAH